MNAPWFLAYTFELAARETNPKTDRSGVVAERMDPQPGGHHGLLEHDLHLRVGVLVGQQDVFARLVDIPPSNIKTQKQGSTWDNWGSLYYSYLTQMKLLKPYL